MAKKQKVESAEKVSGESSPKRQEVRLSVKLNEESLARLQLLSDAVSISSKTEKTRALLALASRLASSSRAGDGWGNELHELGVVNSTDALEGFLTGRLERFARQIQAIEWDTGSLAAKRPRVVEVLNDAARGGDSDKFADLLKAWRNANPIAELDEVVDAMSADGLVQSVSAVGKAGGPAAAPMTTADIVDVQAIVDRAVDRATEQAEAKLAPFVKAITEEIESLKDSRLRTFVVLLVIPVLIAAVFAIINPIGDYYVKKWLEDNPSPTTPREFKQKVRKNTLAYGSDRSDLQQFRFVSKIDLVAHTHPSSGSPTLGKLPLGQVVVLLDRRKAWSSVAWTVDDVSPPVQGWVYSRYVTKIV
ncbi:hypothetical protein [Paraburkholderia sp. J7]|uniref:hypothetical protein n=1 Tax=Paraburkholderia sp. J7 TaxID=2805438 RepID=UPI002AB7094D|nr:hypothetical protein [Paraburkholderia sp. J7]